MSFSCVFLLHSYVRYVWIFHDFGECAFLFSTHAYFSTTALSPNAILTWYKPHSPAVQEDSLVDQTSSQEFEVGWLCRERTELRLLSTRFGLVCNLYFVIYGG